MNINEYIKNSWPKTIQKPVNGIPFPFTSPCITDTFLDFFYWDVYFINKGLYLDGFEKQAENNINNIASDICSPFIRMIKSRNAS